MRLLPLSVMTFGVCAGLLSQSCKSAMKADGASVKADGLGDTVAAPAQIVFTVDQGQITAQQMTRGLNGGQPIGAPMDCTANGNTAYNCQGSDGLIQWASTPAPTISTAILRGSDGRSLVKSYMCRGSWPSTASHSTTITCNVVPYNVHIISRNEDGHEAFTAGVYSVAETGDESAEATFEAIRGTDGISLSGRSNDFAVNWQPTPIPGVSKATLNVNPQAPMQLNCTKSQSSLHSPGGANYTYNCR